MISEKLEVTAALGIASGAVWAVHSAWTSTTPSLSAFRMAAADDTSMHQKLMDSCVVVGGLSLLAGAVVSIATRNVWPVLVMACTFGLLWYVHREALTGPTPPAAPKGTDNE